jgi:hypothetical protein
VGWRFGVEVLAFGVGRLFGTSSTESVGVVAGVFFWDKSTWGMGVFVGSLAELSDMVVMAVPTISKGQ